MIIVFPPFTTAEATPLPLAAHWQLKTQGIEANSAYAHPSLQLWHCAREDELANLEGNSFRKMNHWNKSPRLHRDYGNKKSDYSIVLKHKRRCLRTALARPPNLLWCLCTFSGGGCCGRI